MKTRCISQAKPAYQQMEVYRRPVTPGETAETRQIWGQGMGHFDLYVHHPDPQGTPGKGNLDVCSLALD